MNFNKGTKVFDQWIIREKKQEKVYANIFSEEIFYVENINKTEKKLLKVIRLYGEKNLSIDKIQENIKLSYVVNKKNDIEDKYNFEVIKEKNMEGEGEYIEIVILLPYFVSLKEFLKENELDTQEIYKLSTQIAKQLCTYHKLGIVHGRIETEHIYIDKNNNYILGDYPIIDRETFIRLGLEDYLNSFYAAPEVYLGLVYSEKSDIYSLGIVLYEIINEKMPNVSEDIINDGNEKYISALENAAYIRMSGKNIMDIDSLECQMGKIIEKACAFNNQDRYESIENMIEDIKKETENYSGHLNREKRIFNKLFAVLGITAAVILTFLIVKTLFLNNNTSSKDTKKETEISENNNMTEEELKSNWAKVYKDYIGNVSTGDMNFITASLSDVANYLFNKKYKFNNSKEYSDILSYLTTTEPNDTINARYYYNVSSQNQQGTNLPYVEVKLTNNSKYYEMVWSIELYENNIDMDTVQGESGAPHRRGVALSGEVNDVLDRLGVSDQMFNWAKESRTWIDSQNNQWTCYNSVVKDENGKIFDPNIKISCLNNSGKTESCEYRFCNEKLIEIKITQEK